MKSSKTLSKWFNGGLKFDCTKCGNCCRGRTKVFVNEAEVFELSLFLNESKSDFLQKYTYTTVQDGVTHVSLKSKMSALIAGRSSKECIFLDKSGQCSVYEVRPTQCQTYPFWPSHLIGQLEWQAEQRTCEGIGRGSSMSLVPQEEIFRNMVLHQVHRCGTGPNWSYEDARENLIDSEALAPLLLTDFADEFFATHSSTELYDTDQYSVEETTVLLRRPLGSDDADVSSASATLKGEVGDESETWKQAEELVTTRRLRFKLGARLTHSAAWVLQSPHIQGIQHRIDFSRAVLPVHRAISLIAKHFASKQPSDRALRIGVLGAGVCVLANHLCARLGDSLRPVLVDCCEPDEELLQVAEAYFDAAFLVDERGSGLMRHHEDAVSYLKRHLTRCFEAAEAEEGSTNPLEHDILILDAYAHPVSSLARRGRRDAEEQPSPASSSTAVHVLDMSPLVQTTEQEQHRQRRKHPKKRFQPSQERVSIGAEAPPAALLARPELVFATLRENYTDPEDEANAEQSFFHFVQRRRLRSSVAQPQSCLLVNVYGSRAWAEHVRKSFVACARDCDYQSPFLIKIREYDLVEEEEEEAAEDATRQCHYYLLVVAEKTVTAASSQSLEFFQFLEEDFHVKPAHTAESGPEKLVLYPKYVPSPPS
jgi:Fe-S-cluster containining protein